MGPFDSVRGGPLDESVADSRGFCQLKIQRNIKTVNWKVLSCIMFYIRTSAQCAPFSQAHVVYLEGMS